MRIQIIDSKRNFQRWTSLLSEDLHFEQIQDFFAAKEDLEKRLESSPPDVILCHANDLWNDSVDQADKYEGEFLAKSTQKNAHVLLYSAGSVEVIPHDNASDKISVKTTDRESLAEINRCRPELIHACPRRITDESDLPIDVGLAAITENKGLRNESSALAFVNALIGYDPVFESSLCLLYACLSTDELKQFRHSTEYELLLGRLSPEAAKVVHASVIGMLTGMSENKEVLIRELRDTLLPVG